MATQLRPNDIVTEITATGDVTTELNVASATQPAPGVDQEATIILFGCQISDSTDDDTAEIVFRCYRWSGGTLADGTRGAQVGGDLTYGITIAAMGDPQVPCVSCFWIDRGAQAGAYVVTAEDASGLIEFFYDSAQVSLLSVGP